MAKLHTRLGFLVLHLCLVSSIPVKVNRCPTAKTEREARAIKTCSSIERYHCLYDTDDILVEDCIDYKQLPPGNYPIYNSFATSNPIDYKPCPRHKYQPWPAKSYEITECVAEFKCTSEGQILCKPGNVTTDVSCKCDNNTGYASLSGGCCYPYGTEDCSCFTKCKRNMDIDVNYNCIETKLTPWKGNSTADSYTWNLITRQSIQYNGGPPYIIKIAVTVLTFIILLGCCIISYLLCSYEIKKNCKVYNEAYEIRVFKLLNAAKKGELGTLMSYANEGYIDMADVDYDSRSALHLAACEGHVEVVQYILKHNFCNKFSKDRWHRTAIDDIMWHKQYVDDKDTYEEIIRLINEHDPQDIKQDNVNIWQSKATELINAAKAGHLEKLKSFNAEGTDMNLADSSGRTALHAAAENGIENVVNYLIDTCRVSPFVRCSQKRPIDVVPVEDNETYKRIRNKLRQTMDNFMVDVDKHAEKCPKDDDVQVVKLLNCVARGDIRRLKSFKSASYNMNLCDYDKRTALHIAVSENQEHIVEYLLKNCDLKDAARTIKDRWQMTPLEAAKSEAMPVVYSVFLKYYKELIDTENDDYRAFLVITAAAKGDVTTLKKLNEKKIDMNLMDYDRRTALHLAAAEGQLEAVKYLVDTAKVNVSVSDRGSRYPVDEANKPKIIELLQESQINENSLKSYKDDKVTCHTVTISESMETMPYVMDAALKGKLHLLKNERYEYFTMDSGDFSGNTPLHFAASEARLLDVNYLLLEKYVSPFVRNSAMKSPLDLVEDKIKQLDEYNVGSTATEIHQKLRRSRKKELLKIKEMINKAMNDACTEDVIEDKNFEKHTDDEKIFLFLNKAYKGDIRAIRRYMKTDGTLVNKCDYDKRTALHLAVAEKHHHLIKFLLEQTVCRVNVNAEDRWRETPLMEAKRICDDVAIQLLNTKRNTHFP